MITVTTLIASRVLDSSFKYHIMESINNGISKEEMIEAITQLLSMLVGLRLGRAKLCKGDFQ